MMKRTKSYLKKVSFPLAFIFLTSGSLVNAQYLLKYPGTSTSFYDNGGNLGIGTTTATARLHIKSTSITSVPLLKTESVNNLGTLYGSIQNCVSVDDQNYGIYQISTLGSGLKNYFQDPVIIGNITIQKDGTSSVISTDTYVNTLSFYMMPNSGTSKNPLTVNSNGIRVRSNLITDNFQLLTNPGTNKVLVSDSAGNASWKGSSCIFKLDGLLAEK